MLRRKFRRSAIAKVLTDEELKDRNISGLKGKEALDRVRIEKIKQFFVLKCTLVQREKLKKVSGLRLAKLSILIEGAVSLKKKKA